MTRKYRDPETPEALEAVLRRIQNMTREEWLNELSWRPDGVEETWRMHPWKLVLIHGQHRMPWSRRLHQKLPSGKLPSGRNFNHRLNAARLHAWLFPFQGPAARWTGFFPGWLTIPSGPASSSTTLLNEEPPR
jgi:hypothetical protein